MSGFRICIYGPEVVDLLGFASRFPKPAFLDFEDKVSSGCVFRARAMTMALESINVLLPRSPCRTLIINSLGSLEQLIWDHVCEDADVPDIEMAYGGYERSFQKGYRRAAKLMREFLERVWKLQDKTGVNVVLLSRAKIRTDRIGGEEFGYWVRDLRQGDALSEVAAFCQATFFADIDGRLHLRKGESFTFVAGNPWGLTDPIELDAKKLLTVLSGCVARRSVPDVAATPPPGATCTSGGEGGLSSVGGFGPRRLDDEAEAYRDSHSVPHAYVGPLQRQARKKSEKHEPVGQGAGAISPNDSPGGGSNGPGVAAAPPLSDLQVAGAGPAPSHQAVDPDCQHLDWTEEHGCEDCGPLPPGTRLGCSLSDLARFAGAEKESGGPRELLSTLGSASAVEINKEESSSCPDEIGEPAAGPPELGAPRQQAYPTEPKGRKREFVEARLVKHGHKLEELHELKWREIQVLEGKARYASKQATRAVDYVEEHGETMEQAEDRMAEEAFGGDPPEKSEPPPLPEVGEIPCPVPGCIRMEHKEGFCFDGRERTWMRGGGAVVVSPLVAAGLIDISTEDDGF